MNLKQIKPNHPYEEVTEDIVRYVSDRDNGLCIICGAQRQETHHVIYRSASGTNAPNNLASVCGKCHFEIHHGKGVPYNKQQMLEKIKHNEERFRRRLV